MSEQLRSTGEHGAEQLDLSNEVARSREQLGKRLQEAQERGEATSVETLSEAAKEKAVSGQEYSAGEAPKDSSQNLYAAHGSLKAETYRRTMRHVRHDLRPVDRTFSKIIHNPKVEAISAVAGKTVARPSGILGGGIAALVGSTFLLIIARYYGFTYNYTVFLLLLLGGFVAGILVELAIKAFRRNRP